MILPRYETSRLSPDGGFYEVRHWAKGNPPPWIKAHATETTAARARIVLDVASFLLAYPERLTPADRKAIDFVAEHPDGNGRDRLLKIAAPFYREEIADALPRLRAASSSAARAYAEIAASRHEKATPAELRILARNCRELAPRQ